MSKEKLLQIQAQVKAQWGVGTGQLSEEIYKTGYDTYKHYVGGRENKIPGSFSAATALVQLALNESWDYEKLKALVEQKP